MRDSNQTLLKSVSKLSKAFKFPMETLPIFVDNGKNEAIAYTSSDGLWISKKVLSRDPKNVHVYLAHEIFHWVVNNYGLTHKYTQFLANVITDYKINELLFKLFSYDVSKTYFKGLLEPKWFDLSLDQIGERILKKKLSLTKTCSAEGFPHAKVSECAAYLRRRFSEHLQVSKEIFYLRRDEDAEYAKALASIDRSKLKFDTFPLDKNLLLKSLWYSLWHQKPSATKPEGPLSVEQSLLFSLELSRLRQTTVSNPYDAMIAASKLFMHLDMDAFWRRVKINKTANRISKLTRDAAHSTKSKRKQLQKKLSFLLLKLAYYQKLPSIQTLMETSPVCLRKISVSYSPRTLSTVTLVKKSSLLPSVVPNATVRRIRLLVSDFEKRFPKLQELADDFNQQLNSCGPKTESSQLDDEDSIDNKQRLGPEKLGDKILDDVSNNDSGQGTDQTSKKSQKDAGDAKNQKSEKAKSEKTQDTQASGLSSTAAGNAHLEATSRSILLENLDTNYTVLSDILVSMREVETLIAQMQARNKKTAEDGPDHTYEYGNDLSRSTSEELALLANVETTLDFLVKVSNHQVLLHAPLERKRSAVVLCLDTSGSMHGSFYSKAAGFCLAIMKFMNKERRGVALVTFDSNKCAEIVTDIGQPIDHAQVLNVLTKPSYGGTDFDVPLLRSQEIRTERKWKSVTTFIITDGYCRLSQTDRILQNKSPRDKIIASIVSSDAGASLAPVADEIHKIKRSSSLLEIVRTSHTLF